MFRWACFLVAVAAMLGLFWLVNDLRLELKQTARTVNENLPEILDKTKTSAQTLADLSDDIKKLRDLAGMAEKARDKTLVGYADSVLDLVEESEGRIGLEKLLFGTGLKDVLPAKEWAVAARKEAIWLAFRSKSRAELLARLCQNKYGSEWHIQIGQSEPVLLRDWLSQHHPETTEIVAEKDEG